MSPSWPVVVREAPRREWVLNQAKKDRKCWERQRWEGGLSGQGKQHEEWP